MLAISGKRKKVLFRDARLPPLSFVGLGRPPFCGARPSPHLIEARLGKETPITNHHHLETFPFSFGITKRQHE